MASYLVAVKRSHMHEGHPTDGMTLNLDQYNPNIYDCFVVNAHNPNSAKLFARHWYEMFYNKQDDTAPCPFKCDALTNANRIKMIKKSGIIHLQMYELDYAIPSGVHTACFINARTADEARKIGVKFGTPKYYPDAKLLHCKRVVE